MDIWKCSVKVLTHRNELSYQKPNEREKNKQEHNDS